MSKEWDRENMKTLGTNVKRDTALRFQQYAKVHGTTVGALLRGFIEATVSDAPSPVPGEDVNGHWHLISYRLEDRLKHETAFHNPGNKNPSEMLEFILEDYFQMADYFRQKSK